MAENCDLILQDTRLDKDSLDKLRKDTAKHKQALVNAKPEDLQRMENDFRDLIKFQVEDTIDRKMQEVFDLIKVEQLTQRFLFDPKTGKNATSIYEANKIRMDYLFGRNGVDTQVRTMRSQLVMQHEVYENLFETSKNAEVKSIREIIPESDFEGEVFVRVRALEEEFTPEALTSAKIRELLAGADDAQRLALAIHASNGYSRRLMLEHGVNVRYNPQYVIKRRYDWGKIQNMTDEQFADYMLVRLSPDTFGKTTDIDFKKTELKKLYKELSDDANKRTDILSNKEFNSTKANSIARKFVFKDAKAEYEVFRDLSIGGMRDQFERNARSIAFTAVSTKEFGYNGPKVLKEVHENIRKVVRTEPNSEMEKFLNGFAQQRIDQAQRELTGGQTYMNTGLTTWVNAARTATAVVRLGNALTTAVLDFVDNGRQVFYMNGSTFGGYVQYADNMRKVMVGMNKEQRLQLARDLGVTYQFMSNSEAMRLSSSDMLNNGNKIDQFLNKYGSKAMTWSTLLPVQTGFSKLASGLNGARVFAEMVDNAKLGKLNKYELDTFKEYNIGEKELALLNSGLIERTTTWADEGIFTGAQIRQLLQSDKPQKIAEILGTSPEDTGKAIANLALKYENLLDDFVVRGTPTPELATKTILFKGVENEYGKAFMNVMTQFMDTPVAQAQNMMELMRKIDRVNQGNKSQAAIDMSKHLAVYTTLGVSGYLAFDTAMSMALNKQSIIQRYEAGNDVERRAIMLNIVGRTSALPFVAEMLEYQAAGRYNETAVDAFYNAPAIGLLNDALKVLKPEDVGGIGVLEFGKKTFGSPLPIKAIQNWGNQAGVFDDPKVKDKTFF